MDTNSASVNPGANRRTMTFSLGDDGFVVAMLESLFMFVADGAMEMTPLVEFRRPAGGAITA
jgi:hypothetical protein